MRREEFFASVESLGAVQDVELGIALVSNCINPLLADVEALRQTASLEQTDVFGEVSVCRSVTS